MKRLALIGDLAFHGLISSESDRNMKRFAAAADLLGEMDMVFANLETPVKVSGIANGNNGRLLLASGEVTESLLTMLNVTCVSLANNHITEQGKSGLEATIAMLDKLGIYHTGAGVTPDKVEPVIIEDNNYRLGFIACVDRSTHPYGEETDGIYLNILDTDSVIADIQNLIAMGVDRIICSIHWGNDYSSFFTSRQQETAHRIVKAGATIIMGHHPHTIQGYEIYGGGTILYSLGQLCFGDFMWEGKLMALRKKTKRGVIVEVDRELIPVRFIPTYEKKGNYIDVGKRDVKRQMEKLYALNLKAFSNSIISMALRIRESLLERLVNYFTGYYRQPLKALFSIRNLRKMGYITRDYKKLKG